MKAIEQPNPISLAAVYFEPFFNGQHLNVTGTGFVIRTKSGPVLVTAAHNLTGRHPENGKCLHSQSAVPNRCNLTNYFGKLASDVPLFEGQNDPNTDAPRFRRHHKENVDVALLPLPAVAGQFGANLLHDSLWRPDSYEGGIPNLHVADTCYVVGYPEGLTNHIAGGGLLPLWKTGHLANDPQFPFTSPQLKFVAEDLCLIDATTRPGMSGAPVFVIQAAPGSLPAYSTRSRLVGIYSGRTSDSSDLGLVWKPTIIHEILSQHFATW